MSHQSIESKSESWKMFDRISPRYDLLNHVLSFGQDIPWRRRMSSFLKNDSGQTVLDLAAGTADVLLILFEQKKDLKKGIGIDLADKMLEIGRKKILKKGLTERIQLRHGDIRVLPFDHSTFDVATIAFGIRNVPEPREVLQEMFRVLKNGGRALILEFSLPENRLIRGGYLFYLRQIVPLLGFLLSKEYQAYRYLNQTIELFPYGETFCRMMQEAGFDHTKAHPMMFGSATIYQGDKP